MAKQILLISAAALLSTASLASHAAAQPQYSQPGYNQPTYAQPPGYQAAPPPAFRDGFYGGISLGAGGLTFEDDGEDVDREEAGTFQIRLGTALSERLLIGANLGGWAKEYDTGFGDATISLVHISAEATYYPVVNPAAVDVFVRGGLGFSKFVVDFEGDSESSDTGGAFHVGAGLEKKLGRSFAIGAGIDYHVASFDEGDVKANYWDLALMLTWY